MNNGVVPHDHVYSIGIYSREQPAKFSSTGTCDSTQLLCYKMTESVLRLLKGNWCMWLINLSVFSTNWVKLELERIAREAVGIVFLHIFLRRDICYELRLGTRCFSSQVTEAEDRGLAGSWLQRPEPRMKSLCPAECPQNVPGPVSVSNSSIIKSKNYTWWFLRSKPCNLETYLTYANFLMQIFLTMKLRY